MTCESVNLMLDELVAKELEPPIAARVEAHVASCERCAAEVAELERERDLFARYARPLELDPDASWQAVAARIGAEQRAEAGSPEREPFAWARFLTRPRLAPIAVAVCALVVGTVAFEAWRSAPLTPSGPIERASVEPGAVTDPQPPSGAPAVGMTAPPHGEVAVDAESERTTSAQPRATRPRATRSSARVSAKRAPAETGPQLPSSVAKAEKDYLEAIALLTRDVTRRDSRESQIPAELVAPLRELDANIKLARAAVQTAPNDPVAVQSMLSAYDEKVDVLERIARNQVISER
jgi:anti-sigma factor RsiW